MKKTKIALISIGVILVFIVAINCMNSYKMVYEICNSDDYETVERLTKKPKLINGINTLPLLLPFKSALIGEMTGGINMFPLEAAVFEDKFEIVKLLVESGANVNSVNIANDKNSPLLTALENPYHKQRFEIANYLIKNGADINYSNATNDVPLTLCMKKNEYLNGSDLMEENKKQIDLFEYLIKNGNGIDIPAHEEFGYYKYSTLLEAAVAYDNIEIVRYLIDNGYYSEKDMPKLNGSILSYITYYNCISI